MPTTTASSASRVPRVDIPAKLAGELVFVHDMRVPGMLHGRVVRPPYAGADHGDFIGNTLESVDESSIAHIPGIRAVVVIRDFVGIVAEREEHAEQALRELRVHWKPWPGLPSLDDLGQAPCAPTRPRSACWSTKAMSTPRWRGRASHAAHLCLAVPDACVHRPLVRARALAAAMTSTRSLRVWAGTQNPHVLRADLAKLMGVADIAVDVVRMEAAGCYGRNGADDVAADAALLSRAVGAPGARAAHARAGACVGAQGRRAADAGRRRAERRRQRRRLRLRNLLPVQRRAHAGAAAHAHDRAGRAGLRDGRPHGAAAL